MLASRKGGGGDKGIAEEHVCPYLPAPPRPSAYRGVADAGGGPGGARPLRHAPRRTSAVLEAALAVRDRDSRDSATTVHCRQARDGSGAYVAYV